MPGHDTSSRPVGPILMRDAITGSWLRFDAPIRVLQTPSPGDVPALLRAVETAVEREGLHAAGFVAYDAAPGFDPALVALRDPEFPAAWFALYAEPVAAPHPSSHPSQGASSTWLRTITAGQHRQAVNRIRDWIRSGDTYQVNFTHRLRAAWSESPATFFARLVAAQNPEYGAFIDTGRWVVCSASPELFLRVDGDRVESRPMKGTAARAAGLSADRAAAEALRTSAKDRAENVMIVDMVRHDLGRVAEPGSVVVDGLFAVQPLPNAWQMTTTVRARSSAGLAELFVAAFPPASITGAPKARTMEIIAGLEDSPRRIYTGAVGFVAPGRRMQFSVAIRTLLIDRHRDTAEFGVGGGIVWDSDAGAEWEECRIKALAVDPRDQDFRLIETLRHDPGTGFHLLERHLARLARSAAELGFRSDPAAARETLATAVAGRSAERLRVRLLVSRDGKASAETVPLPAAADSRRVPVIRFALEPVASRDLFLRHKTTRRELYERARASDPNHDDVLLFNERGEATESTIANLVVETHGRRVTPPLHSGLLPGTARADLLERGELEERVLTVGDVLGAERVFLLNSVRGLYEVAPGPR